MKNITVADMRRAGYCVRGIRSWFAANGLDFSEFMANGIPEEKLEAIGDAHANRMLELVRVTWAEVHRKTE